MHKYKILNKCNSLLKDYFGYDELKNIQFDIIYNIVYKNRDVLAVLPTGYGKSLCYQLPFLLTNECVVVISPLISLMEDQKSILDKLNIPNCTFNETLKDKNTEKADILMGNYKIIFMTPEFCINNFDFIDELYQDHGITCFAIDETHCVSKWSDDNFRPKYKLLNCLKIKYNLVPILAITATANKKLQKDIINILKLNNPKIFVTSFYKKKLYIEIKRKTKIKDDIIHLIDKYRNKSIIIYVKTRDMTHKIQQILLENDYKSLIYHAGIELKKRIKIQEKFMSNKINIIIATIAFGCSTSAVASACAGLWLSKRRGQDTASQHRGQRRSCSPTTNRHTPPAAPLSSQAARAPIGAAGLSRSGPCRAPRSSSERAAGTTALLSGEQSCLSQPDSRTR